MGGGVEAGKAQVGVFGGTFDPVHVGHLIVATELRFALGLERILFVPAGRPPHKSAQEVADDEDRLTMLRLALAEAPDLEVSELDLHPAAGGLSYTADLLVRLGEELRSARLVFLMGNDSLRDFPNWYQPGRIAALAELGVAARPGSPVDLAAVEEAVPEARGRVHLVGTPLIGTSSREIRRRVREGAPIRYQVPRAVERFIAERGLYRGGE